MRLKMRDQIEKTFHISIVKGLFEQFLQGKNEKKIIIDVGVKDAKASSCLFSYRIVNSCEKSLVFLSPFYLVATVGNNIEQHIFLSNTAKQLIN